MNGFVDVTEGATRLLVPAGNKERGPGSHDGGVFFNPAMALSRDLSVLLLDHLLPAAGGRVLDGLAASGARAVRFATEVPRANVTANDLNPQAVAAAEENAKLNDVTITTSRRDLGAVLWDEPVWHYVDVDPFGSPAVFLEAAGQAVRDKGVLAVTATDATALAGVYPDVCERRYGATPLRSEFGHDVALRILFAAVARRAAVSDHAVEPLLAHATDHFYRVYVRVRNGAKRANATLATIGHVYLCDACGDRGVPLAAPSACPACGKRVRVGGPLWTGPLQDADLIAAMQAGAAERVLARRADVEALLGFLAEESEAPPLFFDIHAAAARAKVSAPSRDAVFAALADAGFVAKRTHVDPLGVKTDASAAELDAVMRQAT